MSNMGAGRGYDTLVPLERGWVTYCGETMVVSVSVIRLLAPRCHRQRRTGIKLYSVIM